MNLWLVRHAQPLIAPGVCYGASDVPADDAATQAAARALALALPPGTRVASSPLQRCERLAKAVQGLRPDLSCKTDARLAEMDFGRWQVSAGTPLTVSRSTPGPPRLRPGAAVVVANA